MIIVTTKEETLDIFDKFENLLEEFIKPGENVDYEKLEKLHEEFVDVRAKIGVLRK